MKRIRRTSRFKRDVRRMQRRHKDLGELRTVVQLLVAGEALPAKYRDHALSGRWHGVRDLHLASDWVLLYTVSSDEVVLVRTGTHADLF